MNGPEKCPCGTTDLIKGIAVLAAGIVCIAFAYKIILHAIIFAIGLILVYYGLALMKMENVKKWVDEFLKKLQGIMPEIK